MGYKFQVDTNGTMMNDLVATWNLNDNPSNGAHWIETLKKGRGPSAQFVKANTEYLSIADNASLSVGDIDFSFSCWVYLDNKSTRQSIISKGNLAAGFQTAYWLEYSLASDRFRFVVEDGTATSTSINADTLGSPSAARWYHIVAWHDATANTINIEVDNGGVDSVAHSAGSFDDAFEFNIGADANQQLLTFNGRISLVGFWKKALSAAERTQLYNNGKGRLAHELFGDIHTSLISYWNLNEAYRTRYDAIGTNHLTDNNTTDHALGVGQENAAKFVQGNSEYLSIADNASLSTGDISFSFSIWVYVDNPAAIGASFIGKYAETTPTQEWDCLFDDATDTVLFIIRESTGSSKSATSAAITRLAWHHVVGTYDATADEMKLYIDNGTPVTTSSVLGPADTTTAFSIGANTRTVQTFMDGQLQFGGFWKKVLTTTEITALYNNGRGLQHRELSNALSSLTTSLEGYWDLNEASGTRVDSAGSNDLTDNNTVLTGSGIPRAGSALGEIGTGDNTITIETGIVHSAARFTGSGAAQRICPTSPSNTDLETGDIDYTVAGWIYLDITTDHTIIAKSDTNKIEYRLRVDNTDTPFFQIGDGASGGRGSAINGSAISTGAWHLVVGWHDVGGNTVNIKVDNGTTVSTATTGASVITDQRLTLGGAMGTSDTAIIQNTRGRLNQIFFWKKVLTAQELTDLYNGGAGNAVIFVDDKAGGTFNATL